MYFVIKMEDIKNLLAQKDYLLSSTDDDFEYESSSNREIKSSKSITSKKRNGEKRLPTRRPDPNVYNRNALLARENRRKKKVYLETIEKELQDTRKVNRTLVKALKRQLKIAQRLEQEKKYFEGLITNKPEILKLVNVLNLRNIPESDSDMSPFSSASNNGDYNCGGMRERPSTISVSSSLNDADALSIQFDSPSDGSETSQHEISLCDFSSLDFCTFPGFFTDLETDCSLPSSSATWDNIWGHNGCHIDNLILPENTILQNQNITHIINDDHCYVTPSISSIQTPDYRSECSEYIDVEGDCFHIGKVCPNNNWNSSSCAPPLQLLSDQ